MHVDSHSDGGFLIDWRGIDTHVLLKVCFKVCMLMMNENWQ